MQTDRYIAAVDLGSSKISLLVAGVDGENVQVLYYKEVPSSGVEHGRVFNPKKAATALKPLIKDAEDELSIKILQIVVGMPRYEIRQEINTGRMQRSDPSSCITKDEISSLKSMAISNYPLSNPQVDEIYGTVAQSFSADDLICAKEDDIIGVTAENLDGNFKTFIGGHKASSNIDIILNDVGVAPAYKLFTPTAVAKATLTESEKDNGVALVEVGAEVSSVTIYKDGILRHYSSIPFGGQSITGDIKSECSFSTSLAENVKRAYGACMPDRLQSLEEKVLQINNDEDGSYEQLPVKYLSEIITARAREIIEAVLFQIQESGYADKLRNGVVLTGGCAELVNFATMFKDLSGYSVRIGYPRSKNFNSGGCAGVCDTSATATLGMVLESKSDQHLNCIEEIAKAPEAEDETPGLDENGNGSLFGDEGIQSDVITPKNHPKPKPKPRGFSWLGAKLESVFDNTVGNIFNEME